MKFLNVDTKYLLLIKLRKQDYYYMVGGQRAFNISNQNDTSISELYDFILDKIEDMYEDYAHLEFDFDSIQFEFKELSNMEHLSSKSSLMGIKDKITKSEYNSINKGLNLFGNYFDEYLGKPINIVQEDDGVLSVKFDLNNKTINLVDLFNTLSNKAKNPDIYHLTLNSKVYINYFRTTPHIIVVNYVDTDTAIKRAFNSDGNLIKEIKDKLNSDGSIRRTYKNTIITINSNKELEYKAITTSIPAIRKNAYTSNKHYSGLPNPNIGVLDLETYEALDCISKTYSIGFYSSIDDEPNLFYINKDDLDSDKLVCLCIDTMLKDKYKDITFYVHNLENFDSYFISKALYAFNNSDEGKTNPYIINAFNRNKDPIKLTIKRKINGILRTLKLCDSYAILPDSLYNLCKSYKVEVVKDHFPHKFVKKNTLFYIGKTPSITYYKHLSKNDYKSRVSSH